MSRADRLDALFPHERRLLAADWAVAAHQGQTPPHDDFLAAHELLSSVESPPLRHAMNNVTSSRPTMRRASMSTPSPGLEAYDPLSEQARKARVGGCRREASRYEPFLKIAA